MIALVFSCFFYSLPTTYYYLPSIVFYIPFYLSNIINQDNKLNFLIFLSTVYLFIALIINIDDIQLFTLLKSFILTIIYPVAFALGSYLKVRLKDYKFLYKFIPYSFLLLFLIQTTPLLYYEPSAAARQYFGSFLLFYYILINFKTSPRLKKIIILFMVFMVLRIFSMGSLTFLAIFALSLILTLFTVSFKLIYPIKLKIRKSYLKLTLTTLFLISIIIISIYQFQIIDVRRLRAFEMIINFFQSLNFNIIMSISGGRFLSTFAGLQEFINAPFDLSDIFLDKPSISTDNPYYESLLNYSGLGEEYLTARRPNSLVSWLLFNLKILAIPIISHIIFNLKKLIILIFKEKNIKFLIFYTTSFTYILVIGFLTSQPSLCIPWILLGLCSSIEKDQKKHKILNSEIK